ncbi:MAG: histidine kinase dimerization/phospho-acceptor domain-containing protein [Bryobacteraceae bacterium]
MHAQVEATLEQASSRTPPAYTAAMEGTSVMVRGQVSQRPFAAFGHTHLAIQDKDQGLILEGKADTFQQLTPGDWVIAIGKVTTRNGLPVVVVQKLTIEASGSPPLARWAPVGDLLTFRYLGLLVTATDRVIETGENSEGVFLRIGEAEAPLKIFMPSPRESNRKHFPELQIGDRVRVKGISFQYSLGPIHDSQFELIVQQPDDVERVAENWSEAMWMLKPLAAFLLVAALVWWVRERRGREQREIIRRMHSLSEEILDSSSTLDLLGRMEGVLPKVLRITSVRLYLFDRGTRTLNTVTTNDDRRDPPVAVDQPSGFFETGLVNCFQNRIMVTIADTKRSPFGLPGRSKGNVLLPRSVLYIPMLTQGEAIGVLQMENSRKARSFSADEKASAQHLANQAGVAVKLLQQRSVREQLARSEKLAAVGRLISGVVNDLRTPLAAISGMAESAIEKYRGSQDNHELLVIASEAKRASAIVERLVSFAQPEHVKPEPVEIIGLLRGLIRFREREWKASGIQLRNMLKDQKLFVTASQGQIEQVFLNLLVHAEQSLEDVAEKRIAVRADVLARRVFIEIRYTAAPRQAGRRQSLEDEVQALGLDVCKTIITGHSGDLRLVQASERESCFEIELPLMQADKPIEAAAAPEFREPSRRLTALLIEPEDWVERQLMEVLGSRGYRVVPVHSSDEALDLISRLRFDVVFCSTRIEGLNWVEFFDRARGRIGAFTLLAEVFSHDLSMHFQGDGRYLVLKPIEKQQFEKTLDAIESHFSQEARQPELESYS